MAHWITLNEATRQLGVRAQTVYAYVSRGRIAVVPDPHDPRKSLYRAEDVAGLSKRKQVGRKRETLAVGTIFGAEPCIYTGITTFARGQLFYRGWQAVQLSATATLEEVAALLWNATGGPVVFGTQDRPAEGAGCDRGRAFATLARLAAHGHSTAGRTDAALHAEAGSLVDLLAQAFGAEPGPTGAPLHLRLAAGWSQSAAVADLLRQALVLLADHEITSSAFSARITASTGASLPACLLTGLSTFSGPLHGDASMRVAALFDDVVRLGAERVAAHHLRAAIPIPGFGHHLYPDGDPRAAALMARLDPPREIARFIERIVRLTGLRPTIDVALAALVAQHTLPADAAFALFATGRCVGLLAHCIEQLQVGMVIRPRGRYTGPALDLDPPPPAEATSTPDPLTLDKNRIFKAPTT
ncbi:citrate synthase [Ideonella sp. B508-1]|uniref:citrate synthase n=1 Tax=Ideonella sp. B508-1 TaxID=137716 RepID=UPI000347B057|nr:citrate synthase [Ideonella sp. B508-1]